MKKKDCGNLPVRLKQLRAERGLSQYQLADLLGLSRGIIGNYEVGARQPDFSTLLLFANFFGVSTDYLLGETVVRERVLNGKQGDTLAVLAQTLSSLSTDELGTLEGSLRCRDIMGEINNLTEDSLDDLRRYISLLRLRDTSSTEDDYKGSAVG